MSPGKKYGGRKIAVFVWTFLFTAVPCALAVPSLRDIDFPRSFGIDSDHYKVVSIAEGEEPGFLKFQVSAPHGTYDVEGLLPLRKLLHEIEVIERLKNDKAVGGFTQGAIDSVASTGKGLVKLVAHPVQSTKDLGRAGKKLGGKIAGFFRKKETGEKTGFGESLLGSTKREIAKKWGVDVYSENPYLQAVLSKLAKAQLTGKGAVMAASFFLPVSEIAAVVLTASGVNSSADQLVNDNDRWDLYQMNKKALRGLGFTERDAGKFLNSPCFSPREATYLRFYLEALKDLKGREVVFQRALGASSDLDAQKILHTAQIAADAVSGNNDFQSLAGIPEGLVLIGARKMVLITPYDYLSAGRLGDAVGGRIDETLRRYGARGAELWNAGKIAPGYFSLQALKGRAVKDWVLFGEAMTEKEI